MTAAFSGRVPTLASIQRTNAIVLVVTAGILAVADSTAAALACILGGAVVIGNLFLLGVLGRFALASAAGNGGSGAKLGLAALPLKLLMVAGLVYVLFSSIHIDGLGFGLGVLTQITAIIIETGRASLGEPAQ